MAVFAYSIAADQYSPPEGEGFVRAQTIQEAVALIGHPDVNVYPLPADMVTASNQRPETRPGFFQEFSDNSVWMGYHPHPHRPTPAFMPMGGGGRFPQAIRAGRWAEAASPIPRHDTTTCCVSRPIISRIPPVSR